MWGYASFQNVLYIIKKINFICPQIKVFMASTHASGFTSNILLIFN